VGIPPSLTSFSTRFPIEAVFVEVHDLLTNRIILTIWRDSFAPLRELVQSLVVTMLGHFI